MSLTYEVLGQPGQDNALLVRIDSGQAVELLLFDCGSDCVDSMPRADLQDLDHLFFSHLHMDHIGGFDGLFRCLFDRTAKANRIWGPPDTARILQHRFRGFLWNLHADLSGTWHVTDIGAAETQTTRFELAEAFATAHVEEQIARQPFLLETNSYTISAFTMQHGTPTIAYVIREKPRINFDSTRLAKLGLKPGPWMKHVKDTQYPAETVLVGGAPHPVQSLREALLVATPGDSIAYLTDFSLDDAALAALVPALQGCTTLVCEGQYRHADLDLARKHYHMTTRLSAELALQAGVGKLVLFHLSERYDRAEWLSMLEEARAIFPATAYPSAWKLEA